MGARIALLSMTMLRWGGWLVVGALAAVLVFSCTGLHDDASDEPADAGNEGDRDGGGRDATRPAGKGGSTDSENAVGAGASGNGASGSGASAGGADGGGAGGAGGNVDPSDAGSDVAPSCLGDDCAACAAEPCLHGATCAPVRGGRKCTCVPPWFGDSCENNDDAALSALAVTAGALWPAFDPEITEYTVDLGFADKRIAVIPTVRVPEGASIRVEGVNVESGATSAEKSLAINTSDGFSIVVSSNTDTRITYTVTVRRSLVQRAYVKFNATETSTDMAIGSSIAMDDERIFYGLPGAKYVEIPKAGAVDTLLRQRGGFQQGQWIAPPTPQADAAFGSQIAFEDEYLAISAPNEDEGEFVDVGAVYVFERIDGWYQKVARLSQPGMLLAERGFGSALALAGDVLAVGGSQGRVYTYRRVNGQWASQGYLNSATDSFFGTRVATDGTWIAVGGDGPAVELFRYASSTIGNPWEHQGTLLPDTAAENNFGSALAFHDDVLAVASSYACFMGCNGLASVYTFARNGLSWNKVGRIEAQRPPDVPANAAPGWYGFVLGFDGRTIVTSAFAEPLVAQGVYPSVPIAITAGSSAVGAGYVYDASGSDLELTAYLKASNAEGGDGFGSAVGVSDGLIAIGAMGEDSSAGGVRSAAAEDNAALEAGAIYIFGADCSLLPAGAIVPGC
jgi:hypothetical protein